MIGLVTCRIPELREFDSDSSERDNWTQRSSHIRGAVKILSMESFVTVPYCPLSPRLLTN
jgi:hypothetical protein